MKIFLKIIKITFLAILITIGALLVTGWAMQDRIAKYALNELSDTFESPLAAEQVTFSLLEDFPLGSIKFEKLWIGSYQSGGNDEIQPIDTLAKVNSLFVSVDTKDLLDDIFTIRKVELQGGYVKYKIDENGVSNYDFLLSADSTASEPLNLTAEDIILSDFTLTYHDDQQKTRAKVFISNINGSVELENPRTFAKLKGDLQLYGLYVPGTHLDRVQAANLALDFTLRDDTLNIHALAVKTAEVTFSTQGDFVLGKQMYADLTVNIQAPGLAALTKYAPEDLLDSYGISQISGAIGLTSKVKGVIAEGQLPHCEISVDLSKGSLRWQNYPPVYNIELHADADNGPSNSNSTTSVRLSKMAADFSGIRVNLNGDLSNLDALSYDLASQIDIDLDASGPLIPDSLVQKAGGRIQIQMTTKGTMPDSVNSEFVEAALKNTEARVTFDQLTLAADSLIHLHKLSAQLNYADHKIGLEGLNVHLPAYKIHLIDNSLKLEIQGDILRPASTLLNIPSFHVASADGSIDGAATIKGLEQVAFSIKSNLNLDLGDLQRFAPDTLAIDIKGKIVASIQSHGKVNLNTLGSDMEPILYDQSDFDLTLSDISLGMKDTLFNVRDLSGRIVKKDHEITLANFGGTYQGIGFKAENTTIQNLFNTVLRNRPGTLKVNGIYRLGHLDYALLGAFANSQGAAGETAATPPTAWDYDIKGQLFAKKFNYENTVATGIEASYNIRSTTDKITGNLQIGNVDYDGTLLNGLSASYTVSTSTNEVKGEFTAKDLSYKDVALGQISALYNIKDTVYTVDRLKFLGFGGQVASSIKVNLGENDRMEIEMQNNIQNIDMRRMMKEMHDFDQDEMTHENISGILSSENLFLRMALIGDSIVYDDMRMTGDLALANGGIFHYPPVQDMAQYLKKIDNLDTLSFKTINSHIFLFKDAVYVPRTYVVSSAFDVEAIGMQSFGEDYQYHVGVNLREILRGRKDSEMEESHPTKRKRMIRLKASGSNGKYKNGVDKEKDRDAMLTKIKTKERILEFRFQPEYFNFDTGTGK